MVVLFCVMMSFQLFVTPTFVKMTRDFGGVLPWPTQFVFSGGALGASVVLLLLAGLNVARCKRGSTGRTVAGWGAIAVGLACLTGMYIALYLPVLEIAGAIK
jgi:type II secretory pathway component PulF